MSKRKLKLLFVFVIPIILLLPANAQGHIVSESDDLHLSLSPDINFDENKAGSIQLRNATQFFKITQLNDTFLFDPVLISFQLFNFTYNSINSSYFDNQKLSIDLIVTYYITEKDKIIEYANQTYGVFQKDPEKIDFSYLIDPSLQFPNTRDLVDNSSIVELIRDDPLFKINLDFQLRFSSKSFGRSNTDIQIHSRVQSFTLPPISLPSFHNKILGHLSSFPVILQMNTTDFFNSYKLYVPIPLDLTSNFIRTTLATHNISKISNMKMTFRFKIINLENSFEEDPIHLSVSHNQSRLKEKHIVNSTYEYSYNYVPGLDQILEFDLVNYGNSIEIYLQDVTIKIPALFFEPSYNTLELIWMYIVTYRYFAVFLSVTILAAADRENQRRAYEAEIERVDEEYIRKKKRKSVFIDDKAVPQYNGESDSSKNSSGLSNATDTGSNSGSVSSIGMDSENTHHLTPEAKELEQPEHLEGKAESNTSLVLSEEERKEFSRVVDNVFRTILKDDRYRQDNQSINQIYPLNPQRYLSEPSVNHRDISLLDDRSFRNSMSPSEWHLSSRLPSRIDLDSNLDLEHIDPYHSRLNDHEKIDELDDQTADFHKSQRQFRDTIGNHDNFVTNFYQSPKDLETTDPWQNRQPPDHALNEDFDYTIEEQEYNRQKEREMDEIRDYEQNVQHNHFSSIPDNQVIDEQYLGSPTDEDTLAPNDESDTFDEFGESKNVDDRDWREPEDRSDISFNQESAFEQPLNRELVDEDLDLDIDEADNSHQRVPLERQLDKQKNDYTEQKGSKVIPDVDTIEEIWDFIIDGLSIDHIHRFTGIDRFYIFHLIINMMHLNVLINSLELRKKQTQNIDKLRQVAKEQMVEVMGSIHNSLVVMKDMWTSEDIERVVKTKDLTVRDEFELFPNGSTNESGDPLAISLGKTNLLELQAMILSKIAFYARFNDIGSEIWENGVVLSGRSSSSSYKLTVKDILGNLVKNSHVHSQLRSMLPVYKLPKGDLKRGNLKGKQIEDLNPNIRYALESDSLKLLGQISLEALPISIFSQIWDRITDTAFGLTKNHVEEEVVEPTKLIIPPIDDNTSFKVLNTHLINTTVPFNRASFKQVGPISEIEKYRKSPYIELKTLRSTNLKDSEGLSFDSVVRMGFMSLVYWASQSRTSGKSMHKDGFEIFINLDVGQKLDSTKEIMSQVPGSIKLPEYLGFHQLEIDPQERKTLELMYKMLLKHWNPSNDYLLNIEIPLYRKKINDIIVNDDFTKFLGVAKLSNYQLESFHECYDQLMARVAGNYFLSMAEVPDKIQTEFFKYPWLLRYHPRLVDNWIEISHNPKGMDRIIHIPFSDDILDLYVNLRYNTMKYELKQHKSFRKSSIITGGDMLKFISTPLSNTTRNDIIRNGLPLNKKDYHSNQKIDDDIINSLPDEAFLNYTGAQLERYLRLAASHTDPKNSLLIGTEGVGINFFNRLRRDSYNIGLGREFQLSPNIWGTKYLRLDSKTGLYKMWVGNNFKEFVDSGALNENVSIHVNPLPLNEKLSVDLLNAAALQNTKIKQPYAVFDDLSDEWIKNPILQSGALYDLMIRDTRFQLAFRELEILQNQLAELANTGRLIEFGDRPSLLNTLGGDLPYDLTLASSLVKGKDGFTGFKISKYGSSSNKITMEFLIPQIENSQIAHPTFKAKIGPETFQEPRVTTLPLIQMEANLGSFRLGIISNDFTIPDWNGLDVIEQNLIINAYGHDLWDAEKILVKYMGNPNLTLPNYMDSSPKPTWMAIIKEYKKLRARSLIQNVEQEDINIFNTFKSFHENVNQPGNLWERINIESPEFARVMIVDLYNRLSGKLRGLGLSQSLSSSWNNQITDSFKSKKVIGNILEYSGPASHELLNKSDKIQDFINDPRQTKHYDEFIVDSISANRELLTSSSNTKFQEIYATIFQQSILDLERILLLDDYSSTFLWPKRMGTKNDRIGIITSKPNDRWTSQLIKTAKSKFNNKLKQMWASKSNNQSLYGLTEKESKEIVIDFMNLVKPGEQYMDSFKTHSAYKKAIKNGLTLEELSLARPGSVNMAGIKMTLKNNSLSPQVVVTNKEIFLESLKKYIFVAEGAAGSTIKKHVPAFESAELWASFLGKQYYVDIRTGAYGPVPLYNEITDPPLRFNHEMRKIHNIMFNLDKLLLKTDKNGLPKYGTNGGINPNFIRESLANDGVWLYYMILLENAIEAGRPWQSLNEARKDPEFLKDVRIWKRTSLIKDLDGSGSHILFEDFDGKPFNSIFPSFDRNQYQSIAEYMAYHVNYKKIANMQTKTDDTRKILYYYFRASQFENSFLNTNWNGPSSKLPYYLPPKQTNNFIGLRDTLLEVKNQFANNLFSADWLNWSLKHMTDSNELSIYLWLRFMNTISKISAEKTLLNQSID